MRDEDRPGAPRKPPHHDTPRPPSPAPIRDATDPGRRIRVGGGVLWAHPRVLEIIRAGRPVWWTPARERCGDGTAPPPATRCWPGRTRRRRLAGEGAGDTQMPPRRAPAGPRQAARPSRVRAPPSQWVTAIYSDSSYRVKLIDQFDYRVKLIDQLITGLLPAPL